MPEINETRERAEALYAAALAGATRAAEAMADNLARLASAAVVLDVRAETPESPEAAACVVRLFAALERSAAAAPMVLDAFGKIAAAHATPSPHARKDQ